MRMLRLNPGHGFHHCAKLEHRAHEPQCSAKSQSGPKVARLPTQAELARKEAGEVILTTKAGRAVARRDLVESERTPFPVERLP